MKIPTRCFNVHSSHHGGTKMFKFLLHFHENFNQFRVKVSTRVFLNSVRVIPIFGTVDAPPVSSFWSGFLSSGLMSSAILYLLRRMIFSGCQFPVIDPHNKLDKLTGWISSFFSLLSQGNKFSNVLLWKSVVQNLKWQQYIFCSRKVK